MNYTIERVTDCRYIDGELASWLLDESEKVEKLFGGKFKARNFDFHSYAREGYFVVCKRDGKPVGILLARLYESIFDPERKILAQDLLYVSEPATRAALLLMRNFIDFGKANANHIFTQLALKTNINAKTPCKLGFKKIEEVYEIEVD